MKLLRQLSLDLNIRVDEVKVQFPIKSKDYVSVKMAANVTTNVISPSSLDYQTG